MFSQKNLLYVFFMKTPIQKPVKTCITSGEPEQPQGVDEVGRDLRAHVNSQVRDQVGGERALLLPVGAHGGRAAQQGVRAAHPVAVELQQEGGRPPQVLRAGQPLLGRPAALGLDLLGAHRHFSFNHSYRL